MWFHSYMMKHDSKYYISACPCTLALHWVKAYCMQTLYRMSLQLMTYSVLGKRMRWCMSALAGSLTSQWTRPTGKCPPCHLASLISPFPLPELWVLRHSFVRRPLCWGKIGVTCSCRWRVDCWISSELSVSLMIILGLCHGGWQRNCRLLIFVMSSPVSWSTTLGIKVPLHWNGTFQSHCHQNLS